MNFVKELNEAARLCPNITLRNELKATALAIRQAASALVDDLSLDNIKVLTGLAAHGWRLKIRADETPPMGGGGKMPVVQERRAA